MTKSEEARLVSQLKQEGKLKGLQEKALDNFVNSGLIKAREKQLGKVREPVRPMMGENARRVDQ